MKSQLFNLGLIKKRIYNLNLISDKLPKYFSHENINWMGIPEFTFPNLEKDMIKNLITDKDKYTPIVASKKFSILINRSAYDLDEEGNLRGDGFIINIYKPQASGIELITNMLYLKQLVEIDNLSFLLIEEPESYLHPKWQKYLPKIYQRLSEETGCQIIVSTHSPFIISAAGEIAKKEEKEGRPISQNVYMIEDGKCLNPDGSSGKDVKGVAATMLGAGIEDLTPSTVVFCAESEKEFLERINKKWYFKDILFRTPSNGGDSHLNKMAYIGDIFKFGGDFFPNAQILYYRDCFDLTQKTDKDMKQKYDNNEKFRNKLILSTESSFEAKFGEDSKIIGGENGIGKVKNAKDHAERLVSMGENGKLDFEAKFPELDELFGFKTKK